MKVRIISGLIMVPLLLLVYFGGYPIMVGAMLVGAFGITELLSGFAHMNIHGSKYISYSALVVLYALYIFAPHDPNYILAWLSASVVASAVYVFDTKKRRTEDGLVTLLAIIYVVFFSFHVLLVADHAEYSIMKWLIFTAAFGTDISAYFSGMLFGKHKLCPDLSPKKTIEGAIGGTIGATIIGFIIAVIFARSLILHFIIASIIASILSQLGDLTASAYKRKMGIKDYGNLIPGHGGIMDRFDSVLFTAPAIYYYIVIVMA